MSRSNSSLLRTLEASTLSSRATTENPSPCRTSESHRPISGSSSTTKTLSPWLSILGFPFEQGKIDAENRPFSRFAFHLYPSPVVLDDSLRDHQPQARARFLRGKKGLKQGLPDFFSHPHSRIFHPDFQVLPSNLLEPFLRDLFCLYRQAKPSPLRHGLNRVEEKVQEDLLQLV